MTDKEKILNGYEIARTLYDLQKERMARLKKLVRALKSELQDFNITESELDEKAKKILKSNALTADLEEARYMAVIELLSERS